jgi:hypothetical protein
MLYREIIAVCSEIHTKHINTLRGQNGEFLNVKSGGTSRTESQNSHLINKILNTIMVSENSSSALLIFMCGTLRYIIFLKYIISNF